MAAGAQARSWEQPSRRRVPRYGIQAPLDVTMLRSGIPDTVPGRSLNLCERGLGAVLAGEMIPGEPVGVEVRLPLSPEPLRAKAVVRYQDHLRCGLEFVGLSAEQQVAIRTWAEMSKAPAEPEPETTPAAAPGRKSEKKPGTNPRPSTAVADSEDHKAADSINEKLGGNGGGGSGPGEPGEPGESKKRRWIWVVLLLAFTALAAAFWWRWNRGWQELESGLPNHSHGSDAVQPQKAEVQVPAEEMQKLLVHRVDPEYPTSARQDQLQGVIVLEVVVGRDGAVLETRAMNGPEVLAHAAAEAVRWWRFQPYLVQGQPSVVETTVAIEFKP